VFLCAQAAAEQMIRTKSEGSIILIASMSATVANRDLDCVAYNASKAGVLQMGRNLACEWGRYKIRVNVNSLYSLVDYRRYLLGILRQLW
jgi:NAD(P)-dependent dehydrogenase (short-subunit alcohol dehydrogenase family)